MQDKNVARLNEDSTSQEEKMVKKETVVRTKMARNRLILVTLLNVLSFLCFVFAMAYYKWVHAELNFKISSQSYYFWINLLYVKDESSNSYEHFGMAQGRICQNDLFCESIFYSLGTVGYLCFSIFCIGGLLQLYDISRIFYGICWLQVAVERKENFKQIITIFTYLVGLTLSIFSTYITKDIFPGEIVVISFGVSFWLCVATLIFFTVVTVYEQMSIRKVIKEDLIKKLLDQEMETRKREQELKKENNVGPSESEHQPEEGLTI
jgi:hypothetical protein